jgi:3'(2'), 5'-bisphosphate nucleotidase
MPLSDQHLQFINHLIQSCGREAQQMAQQQFQVYEKGSQDYVTDVDHRLDQQLTRGLSACFPGDAIISEENDHSWQAFIESSQRLWLVDPIDGTSDLIQGRPDYAVMVGLLIAHQPTAGWIYAPAQQQLYYGGRDIGLFQGVGNASVDLLQPVAPLHPCDSFCPIMLGYQDQQRYGRTLARLIPAARFYNIGSFGLKVMQVICGKAGLYLYLNRRVKLWDTTAPLALAAAAGLVCCDLYGEPLRFTPELVDPVSLVHRQMIVIGWRSYVNALLPCIQQAVMEVASPSAKTSEV